MSDYELGRIGRSILKVDWDYDLDFADASDDISDDLWHGQTLVIERGLDQARALGRPLVPMMTGKLRNQEGTYSTEYSGSPIYGLLKPGRPIIFSHTLGGNVNVPTMDDAVVAMDDPEALMDGESEFRLFTGFVDVFPEEPGRFFRRTGFRALGTIGRLKGVYVTVAYNASITTGAAVVAVLQAAGLSSDEYVVDQDAIDNGRLMYHWYAYRREAWTLLEEIWATEGPPASLYEDKYGRWVFEGRNYFTLTERCQVVQHTFTDTTVQPGDETMDSTTVAMDSPRVGMDGSTTADHYISLNYEPGYKYIVNDATIEITQKAVQSLQVVWLYNGSISLGAGESVTVFAKLNDPISTVTTPVSGTDYDATNALASINATIVGGTTVILSMTAGSSTVISGHGGAIGIAIRGTPVTTVTTLDAEPTVDASDSIAEYGVRSIPGNLSIWRTLNEADAAGLADAYLLQYSQPRPIVNIKIQNRTPGILKQILSREINDRIHIIDQNGLSGVDLDVQIRTMRYIFQGNWLVGLELGCEKIVEQDWGLWDVAEWDVDVYGQ